MSKKKDNLKHIEQKIGQQKIKTKSTGTKQKQANQTSQGQKVKNKYMKIIKKKSDKDFK